MADERWVGLTSIEGVVSGPLGQQRVELLIDTGAQYSLLPHQVWTSIGLRPTRTRTFHLANGASIERTISECLIELPEIGGETPCGHTPVILGEPGDVALLGVVTLEELGLLFNPIDRSLGLMLDAPLMRLTA